VLLTGLDPHSTRSLALARPWTSEAMQSVIHYRQRSVTERGDLLFYPDYGQAGGGLELTQASRRMPNPRLVEFAERSSGPVDTETKPIVEGAADPTGPRPRRLGGGGLHAARGATGRSAGATFGQVHHSFSKRHSSANFFTHLCTASLINAGGSAWLPIGPNSPLFQTSADHGPLAVNTPRESATLTTYTSASAGPPRVQDTLTQSTASVESQPRNWSRRLAVAGATSLLPSSLEMIRAEGAERASSAAAHRDRSASDTGGSP